MRLWLKIAETIDALRVFPRLFLTAFFGMYVWLVSASWAWYTGLDLSTIGWENLILVTAFPVAIIGALGKMFANVYTSYQESGRDWTKEG